MKNLSSFRVAFGPNVSVGGTLEEAKIVFELANGCVYLEYEPYYATDCSFENYILERFKYYCKDLNQEEYNCGFFKKFSPRFQIVDQHIHDTRYHTPSDHLLLKIDDFRTFVFFLTTNSDEYMSIFSSDFDKNFFKTYLNDYYKNKEKYGHMTLYQYVLEKHRDYIAAKKFIFYDTYSDDENDNYLFVSGNKAVIKSVKHFRRF